jgi:hypothetical protein
MEQIFHMTLKESGLHYFFPLFQQGVTIKTPVGGSIKDLLVIHLGMIPEYVENRIQTIFLDGKAVDDLEKTAVRDGSILALSAAMPGLVGATLRKGGVFASLRQAITFSERAETIPQREGRIVLKLFNMLVPELGPLFLAKGIWLKGEELNQLLGELKNDFWEECREIVIDGRKISGLSEMAQVRMENDALVFFMISPWSISNP